MGLLNKKAQKTGTIILTVIGIIVAAQLLLGIDILGQVGLGGLLAGPTPDVAPGIPGIITGQCLTTDKVTVTFDAEDALAPAITVQTTADQDDGILYTLNGGSLQPSSSETTSVDDGGTITFSPTDTIVTYFAWDSDTGGGHYTTKTTQVVQCTGSETFTGKVFLAPTSLNFKVFNENGDVVTEGTAASSVNITLTASDDQTFDLEWRATPDTGLPHGGVFVCDFNKTSYASIDFTFEGVSKSAEVPTIYADDRPSYGSEAWVFPAITDNNVKKFGSVRLRTTSSYVSGQGGTAGQKSTIACALFDNDYFVNDDGDVLIGPEDEDDNSDIGSSTVFRTNITVA